MPGRVESMTLQLALLLLALAWPLSPARGAMPFQAAPAVAITNPRVTGADSLTAWLLQPAGAGPFAAVVLLHGCAGVTDHHRHWAQALLDWGYAALIVDSFDTRGGQPICRAGDGVWAEYNRWRVADAGAALEYLDSLAQIDGRRVVLMGWSYGGTITLKTLEGPVTGAKPAIFSAEPGFRAGIAFYPSCWHYLTYLRGPARYNARAPLHILLGEADDWTRPQHCRRLVAQAGEGEHAVSLHLYPGAYHAFDDRRQWQTRLWGVRLESHNQPWGNVIIGYSKRAHRAASKDIKSILARHLRSD